MRLGDLRQAKAEAAAGLRVVGGNDTYKRDLKVLLADLRVREREL